MQPLKSKLCRGRPKLKNLDLTFLEILAVSPHSNFCLSACLSISLSVFLSLIVNQSYVCLCIPITFCRQLPLRLICKSLFIYLIMFLHLFKLLRVYIKVVYLFIPLQKKFSPFSRIIFFIRKICYFLLFRILLVTILSFTLNPSLFSYS